ncbi:hypothetical protein CROQUDRAFT_671153 [Cronartium quercuum f. sp. fusiforme G11]|uniref:Uncharacterized protein n=1 Tax=Cronartium quercuum f. sp. fusiforme G11 TaxID=708437 RepID=A0A9P6NLU5_9BASI|nr:hypothetical protein CROQUDRAFT_671153 [Cronartium quercuum f. sp. fusiforme G11]
MPYLLSRAADPIFGVFSGLLAFYLTEMRESREWRERSASTTGTALAPPPASLRELLKWKYHQRFPASPISTHLNAPDGTDEVLEMIASELKNESSS